MNSIYLYNAQHYIKLYNNTLERNVNTHKKPSITPRHIQTTRLLCECELFAPQNYDNDPEIKRVMQQFYDRTTQRFQEYDEKLQEKRQIYKDKCDKEIQKIILKDKLEKELTEKFAILQTDIHSDAIPTCVCEKSIADKVEKSCLKCGKNLGGFIPGLGLIGGTAVYAAAVKSATDLGIKIGIQTAVSELMGLSGLGNLIGSTKIKNFVTSTNYLKKMDIVNFVQEANITMCSDGNNASELFCYSVNNSGNPSILFQRVARIAEIAQENGAQAASGKFAEMTSVSAIFSDPVVISAIVVVTIAVILLIIYLILRYRRKKKMKKKLQYIKLLEE
ncbi:rifin [Plasmodium falciparum IGH-CR14]|uniref:Rifin n=1 Tax=Plasmodium falciparum IGH-CR14 TaxID=580059 RepID=A0A0L1I525_PLAFA|nr:rifin [Plasmodium falciparum IGH-CR14]